MKKFLSLLALMCLFCTGAWADDVFRYHRYDTFKSTPIKSNSIVFVGNSITNMHPWVEAFGNDSRIVNRGCSGATSAEILREVRSYCVGQPAKIFLMIGINDQPSSSNQATVANNILETVRQIRSLSPNTMIYVQSILPSGWFSNPENIKNCNTVIQQLLTQNYGSDDHVMYLDVYSQLLGKLNTDNTGVYSFDKLHTTAAGYAIWTDFIKSYVDINPVYPSENDTKARQLNGGNDSSWGARATYFSMFPIESEDVLFFGDEMVHGGEWQELLGNVHVKNRGTSWDYEKERGWMSYTKNDVKATFTAVEGVSKVAPKQVLLYTGTGEVNGTGSMSTIVDYYKGIVTDIRNYTSPSTKISLVSLMPTTTAGNARVKEFNAAIKAYADATANVEYIDIYSVLATNDNVNTTYFPASNNYLYGKGYVAVANELAKHIDNTTPVSQEQAKAYRALIDGQNADEAFFEEGFYQITIGSGHGYNGDHERYAGKYLYANRHPLDANNDWGIGVTNDASDEKTLVYISGSHDQWHMEFNHGTANAYSLTHNCLATTGSASNLRFIPNSDASEWKIWGVNGTSYYRWMGWNINSIPSVGATSTDGDNDYDNCYFVFTKYVEEPAEAYTGNVKLIFSNINTTSATVTVVDENGSPIHGAAASLVGLNNNKAPGTNSNLKTSGDVITNYKVLSPNYGNSDGDWWEMTFKIDGLNGYIFNTIAADAYAVTAGGGSQTSSSKKWQIDYKVGTSTSSLEDYLTVPAEELVEGYYNSSEGRCHHVMSGMANDYEASNSFYLTIRMTKTQSTGGCHSGISYIELSKPEPEEELTGFTNYKPVRVESAQAGYFVIDARDQNSEDNHHFLYSTGTTFGTAATIDAANYDNYVWHVTKNANGTYYFKNVGTGKYITIGGSISMTDAPYEVHFDFGTTDNAVYGALGTGNDKWFDCGNQGTSNTTWGDGVTGSRRMRIFEAEQEASTFTIQNKMNSKYATYNASATDANGNHLAAASTLGNEQKIVIESAENGFFTMRIATAKKKYVYAINHENADSNVGVCELGDGENGTEDKYLWAIKQNTAGYYNIIPKDGSNGWNKRGTVSVEVIGQWSSNNTDDNRWIFAETEPYISHDPINVTYTFTVDGKEIGQVVRQEITNNDPTIDDIIPEYVNVEGGMPAKVTEDAYTINTSYKASVPFEVDTKFYYMNLTDGLYWIYANNSQTNIKEAKTKSDDQAYIWRVGGDWLNGFTFRNLLGYYIAALSNTPANSADTKRVTEATELAHFDMEENGTSGYRFKPHGGTNYLAHTSANALNLQFFDYYGRDHSYNSSNRITFVENTTAVAALQEKVNAAYAKKGEIGYPVDMESLAAYIDDNINAANYDAADAALTALYAVEDINLPVKGKAYRIAFVKHDGTKCYIPASGNPTTDVADAAIFVTGEKGVEGYNFYFAAANNGNYLNFKGASTASYGASFNDFKVLPLSANTASTGLSATYPAEKRFGFVYMLSAARPDNANSMGCCVMQESDNTWSAANAPFFNGNHTSALVFEEVDNLNIEKLTCPSTAHSGGLNGKFVGTFSAPYNVELRGGVKAYIASLNEAKTAVVFSQLGDGTIVPKNTGVLLYAENAENVINDFAVPAATATLPSTAGNLFVGTNDTGATLNEGDLVLGNGNNGVGFYKINPKKRTVARNKAYIPATAVATTRSLNSRFAHIPNVVGDIDCDGEVTIVDVTLMIQRLNDNGTEYAPDFDYNSNEGVGLDDLDELLDKNLGK